MQVIRTSETKLDDIIGQVVKVLQAGGMVIYPTETCYGLGVDATSEEAVKILLKYKTRREGKAISIAVVDEKMAERCVELNMEAKNLYREFLPGPMTVISRVNMFFAGEERKIVDGVVSEGGTLGVRIPDHEIPRELVKKIGRPITATSANVSYQSSPYSLTQWQKQTPKAKQDLVDIFINVGELPRREPSTVVDTTVGELQILRVGSIELGNKMQERITGSEEETVKLGEEMVRERWGEIKRRGLVVGLQGRLGAGKTRLAKGMGKSMGVSEVINSPSFNIVHEYVGEEGKFYHIDLWRVEAVAELDGLGIEQMLGAGKLVVVEWAEVGWPELQRMIGDNEVERMIVEIEVVSQTSRRVRW